MHYMIGSQMGLIAVPFIFVVGAAYLWIVDRLLNRHATIAVEVEAPRIAKAA